MPTIIVHPGTGFRVFEHQSRDEFNSQVARPDPRILWDPPGKTFCLDTRKFRYGDRLFNLPNGTTVEVVSEPQRPVDCAVVVDLGNTRSCALLVDDVRGEHQEIVRLRRRNYATGGVHDDVFRSMVTLESVQTFNEQDSDPISPVRMGGDARDLFDLADDRGFSGICSSFSPKQVFWSDAERRTEWRMVDREAESVDDWQYPKQLESLYFGDGDGKGLPRSALFEAMIMEILEQAESQLNSRMPEPGKVMAVGPRVIRHLEITYPPAWSQAERLRYRDTIQKAADAWCRRRALPQIAVRVECDEASASLLAYVACEAEKYGQGGLLAWMRAIGKADQFTGGYNDSFAVIDLGGGTSDLTISSLSAIPGIVHGASGLIVNHRCKDGVNFAGDEFIRRVIAKVVLPRIARATINDPAIRKRAFDEAVNGTIPRESPFHALRIEFYRRMEELAIEAIGAWGRGGKTSVQPGSSLGRGLCSAIGRLVNATSLDQELKTDLGLGERMTEAKQRDILTKFNNLPPDDDIRRVAAIARDLFSGVAQQFAKTIQESGCGRVLFVGKTSENDFVYRVFQEALAAPSKPTSASPAARLMPTSGRDAPDIVRFNGYDVSPSWVNVAATEGNRLSDVKLTTVMGAAIDLLAGLQCTALGFIESVAVNFANETTDLNYVWGIAPRGSGIRDFGEDHAVFLPNGEGIVQLSSVEVPSVLLRKRPAGEGRTSLLPAQIAYEIRLRDPDDKLMPGSTFLLRRDFKANQEVSFRIDNANGMIRDGNGCDRPLTNEDIVVLLRMSDSDSFWLDTGTLGEEVAF